MIPEEYGAQLTSLDQHLDTESNSDEIMARASGIPVFHWPRIPISADPDTGYQGGIWSVAAIPIVDDLSTIRDATANLLSHLGYDSGYAGLKLGEQYLSSEELLEQLAQKWQAGNEVAWSAEHVDNEKTLGVLLDRSLRLLYDGDFIRAPRGEAFAQVSSRAERPIKRIFTIPELAYLEDISLKESA